MNKSAVVGTVVICASIAFAAQQQSGQQPSGQPQRGPSGGGVADDLGQGQPMGSVAGGGCTDGPPLNWFTVLHVMPECWTSGIYSFGVDVNGDATLEFLRPSTSSAQVVASGALVVGNCLCLVETLTDGGTGVMHSCVAMSESVGAIFIGSPYFATEATFQDLVWGGGTAYARDMDGDRDLDLFGIVSWSSAAGGAGQTRVWLENTGYEYNPPLAADINGDGTVNGIDLTAVLAAWTDQE